MQHLFDLKSLLPTNFISFTVIHAADLNRATSLNTGEHQTPAPYTSDAQVTLREDRGKGIASSSSKVRLASCNEFQEARGEMFNRAEQFFDDEDQGRIVPCTDQAMQREQRMFEMALREAYGEADRFHPRGNSKKKFKELFLCIVQRFSQRVKNGSYHEKHVNGDKITAESLKKYFKEEEESVAKYNAALKASWAGKPNPFNNIKVPPNYPFFKDIRDDID